MHIYSLKNYIASCLLILIHLGSIGPKGTFNQMSVSRPLDLFVSFTDVSTYQHYEFNSVCQSIYCYNTITIWLTAIFNKEVL